MNQSLQIGPLALPYSLLLTLAAIGLGGLVGGLLARRAGVDAEPALTRMLLVSLLAARLAFVWQWRELYFAAPLDILDIRDGGWEPAAGVAAAFAVGLYRSRAQRALRKPVLAASVTAGAVMLLASVAMLVFAPAPIAMPALQLSTLDGQPMALTGFSGKPTVINLWATWCPPCQREMPVLEQAQAANPDIHVVFVNQGETQQDVAAFLDRFRLKTLANVLLDPQHRTGMALGHRGLPTTLFFDARGQLVDTRVGQLSEATLAQRLSELRASPARSPLPSR